MKHFTMEYDHKEHKFSRNEELRAQISRLTRSNDIYVNVKDLTNSFLDVDATARFGNWNLLHILRQLEMVEQHKLDNETRVLK